MKRPCPTRSSMLSPKIHRYHMLPMTCDQLPCRNIELTRVGVLKSAGTTPYSCRNTGRISAGRGSSYSHATAFRTISVTGMEGGEGDGMTSRRGVIELYRSTFSVHGFWFVLH